MFICFAVLDGIGKGLDPRFDITEIAKPWVWFNYFLHPLSLFHVRDCWVFLITRYCINYTLCIL